jgi:hypothetical protein
MANAMGASAGVREKSLAPPGARLGCAPLARGTRLSAATSLQ